VTEAAGPHTTGPHTTGPHTTGPHTTGPHTTKSLARLAAALLGCAGASVGLAAIAPHVGLPVTTQAWAARASFAFAFAFVTSEMLLVAALAAPLHGPRALAFSAGMAAGLGVVAAVQPTAGAWVSALVALLLLGAGSALGAFVGNHVLHVGHLGVVALVSSLADALSVFHESGPTAQILESAPTLALLAIAAPMPGTPDIPPILGVGDVVVAALYVAAATKHGLSRARTVVALGAGLAVTLGSVLLFERALPALPFLGAAVVVAHPAARLPPREERREAAIGIAVVVALAAWLWPR